MIAVFLPFRSEIFTQFYYNSVWGVLGRPGLFGADALMFLSAFFLYVKLRSNPSGYTNVKGSIFNFLIF